MRPGRRTWAVGLVALVLAGAGCSRTASREQQVAWNAEIGRLQAEYDSLRARADTLVARDPRLLALPKGDVVLSVPTSFLHGVIVRVLDDVAENVTLSLSGLKAHVATKVKKIVTLGTFNLDVDIDQVSGRLKPGEPDIRFGDDRIDLSLPVDLVEGQGNATLHCVWDGKNVADLACGDLDVTQKLSGTVIPSRYVVAGSMTLAIRGNEIVCTPVFPETKVRIRVKPSAASWAAVDSLLAEKHGVCGWVLDKVDVPHLLEGIVQEKGFNVKLPVHKIRPFALPAGVQDTLRVARKVLTFETRTNTLRIDPEAVWYSADVTVRSE